jgi:TolB-like protein/DNA-binding SARP family transcriptional activator/cytochrome c-type biogenesis protein CcmH/NrfG
MRYFGDNTLPEVFFPLIKLHLLGTVDLRSDGVEVRSVLAQPKRLALLAYLASAAPRGFHSRDTLLALFWPESDGERARNSLRQALHQLRRSLGDDVLVSRGDREVGLDPERFWCDAAAFDQAVEEVRYEDALKLYRGDLLPGFFVDDAAEAERWLEEERARRRRAAVDAAWKLAEREESRGEWRAAALWAERAVGFVPSEETALRRLLVLLDRAGEPAAALAAFADFERRLESEFGLTPSAETLRLVQQLRHPAPAAASPTPAVREPGPSSASAGTVTVPIAETAPIAETPASAPVIDTPVVVPVPVETARAAEHLPKKPRRWGRIMAAAAAVLVLLAAGWFGMRPRGAQAEAAEAPSIAVLPFVNLSGNKDNDYFSDGLAEELLNVLAQVPDLRVASRTSSFGYRGNDVPVDSIGRALRVAHVLEGSVRQYGQRLRITAQLIDTRTGYHLWSETYDRELRDVFAIQDEISRAIVDQLNVRLAARRDGGRPETTDPEAYAQVLKANFAFNQSSQSPRDRYATAAGFLEEAIRIDPNYAEAYAKLADATQGQAYRGYVPAQEGFARARQLAERALALDPGMARAHYVLGRIAELHEWDFPSAQEHYRRSIELAAIPEREPPPHAFVLLRLGRRDEAVAAARKASELQPDWPGSYNNLGSILSYVGDYDGAIEAFTAAQALAPSNPNAALGLANTYVYAGRGPEAVAAAEAVAEKLSEEPSVLGALGSAYALAGRRADAERVLRTLASLSGDTRYAQASVHASLGNGDQAFALLDQAVAQREPSAPDLGIDPVFARYRSDPRMAALLRRIGLPVK